MSIPPDPKRLRLSNIELSELTKEEILGHWADLEKYVDHLETKANGDGNKESSELVSLRESEEKLKQQQAEATRRENVLVMRLTTKEQEMQEYASQIQELKRSQVPGAPQLRSSLLDPAVNLMFERMKKGLDSTKAKLEDTQNDLSAWKFTPDSNTGKRLMAKCRLLHQENEELGKIISSGRVAKLEGDLALQRNFSEEMKKSQADLDEFLMELDEDVEGMQSTIYYLQQQLREAKEQVTKLQQENLSLKSPMFNQNDAATMDDRGLTSGTAAAGTSEEEQSATDAGAQRDSVDDDVAEPMDEGTTGSACSPRSVSEDGGKSKSTTPPPSIDRNDDVVVDQETNSSSCLDASRRSPQSPDEDDGDDDDRRRTRTPSPPSPQSRPYRTREDPSPKRDGSAIAVAASVVPEESSEEAFVTKESRTREATTAVAIAEDEDEESFDGCKESAATVAAVVNNGDSLLASPASNAGGRMADEDDLCPENGHVNNSDDEESRNVTVDDADSRTSRTPSPRTPAGTPPSPSVVTSAAIDGKTLSDDDDDGRRPEDAGRSDNTVCMSSKKATLNGLSDNALIAKAAIVAEEPDGDL